MPVGIARICNDARRPNTRFYVPHSVEHRTSVLSRKYLYMKSRISGEGVVANPRDTTRYRCGLRLALTRNTQFRLYRYLRDRTLAGARRVDAGPHVSAIRLLPALRDALVLVQPMLGQAVRHMPRSDARFHRPVFGRLHLRWIIEAADRHVHTLAVG